MASGLLAQGRLSSSHQLQKLSPFQVRHASTTPADAAAASAPAIPDASFLSNSADVPMVGELDKFVDGSALLGMSGDHIGYLKAMGLEFGWGPTSFIQSILEHIHVWTGLPWWASLAVLALGMRLAFVPATIKAQVMSEKMVVLKQNPKFSKAMEETMALMTQGNARDPNTRLQAMKARETVKRMQQEHGVNMKWAIIPMLQMPFGIGAFRLLHAGAALPVPSFETGGLLWFQNLTLADPYYILPLAGAGLLYVVFQHVLKTVTTPEHAAMAKTAQYILIPLSFIITVNLSAGGQFFIVLTSVFQVLQMKLLRHPLIRPWAGLGPLPPQPGFTADGNRQGTPVLNGQASWSAPRTISTTAKSVDAAAAEPAATPEQPPLSAADQAGVNTNNPITNAQNAWGGVRSKLSSYTAKGRAKQDAQSDETHEKRRAREDRDAINARRREAHSRKRRQD